MTHYIRTIPILVALLAIMLSPMSRAVLKCEQPGNTDGINIVEPPADLPVRYEHQVLKADDAIEFTAYGRSVALDGSWLAVTAELHPVTREGFVDLYHSEGGNWIKVKTWTGPQLADDDVFATTSIPTAVEGDLLVLADQNALANTGRVTVYQRDLGGANQWGLLSVLNGNVTNGRFGAGLAVDNRRLAVISREGLTPSDISKGVIYILDPAPNQLDAWNQSARLEIPASYSEEAWLAGFPRLSGDHITQTIGIGLGNYPETLAWHKSGDEWQFNQGLAFPESCRILDFVVDGDVAVASLRESDAPREEHTSSLVFFERNPSGQWVRGFELDTSVYLGNLAILNDQLVAADRNENVVAYVFERQGDSSEWAFTEQLMSRDLTHGASSSVTMNGNSVALGSVNVETAGVEYSGAVFTYQLADLAINPGFNDAWIFSDVPRQGILFTVLPLSKLIFLAWFTFDTELPIDTATANLGGLGQRWLTAIGPYEGKKALLDIEVTTGGIFDNALPLPGQAYDGTIELEFTDCRSGTFTYNIPSLGLNRTIGISRAVNENVGLCESWGQTPAK